MKEKRESVVQNACHMLRRSGIDIGIADPSVAILQGDGSQRSFYRLCFEHGRVFIAIAPGKNSRQDMEEAYSAWHIGCHLRCRGIQVPEFIAFDKKTGVIISEDLGDVRLYEYVRERNVTDKDVREIYQRIVLDLVGMQVKGAEGFQASWCYQTPVYNRELILKRESGYFVEALCHGYLQIDSFSPMLQVEFEDIADKATQAPADFFLHRDFQSRNIMIKDGKVRFIDFQAGRFGPLGYDLASLLIDPYTAIPEKMQDELLTLYIRELQASLDYDAEQFRREYLYLCLSRNLQILGAFAFLSHRRGKMFFRPFIRPALYSLKNILIQPECTVYKALRALTDICLEKVE